MPDNPIKVFGAERAGVRWRTVLILGKILRY